MKSLFPKRVFIGLIIMLAFFELAFAQEQIVHGINGNFEINSQFIKAKYRIQIRFVT